MSDRIFNELLPFGKRWNLMVLIAPIHYLITAPSLSSQPESFDLQKCSSVLTKLMEIQSDNKPQLQNKTGNDKP